MAARADQITGPSKAQISAAEVTLRHMRGLPGLWLRLEVYVVRPVLVSWIGVRKAVAYSVFYTRWGWYWLEHFGRYPVHYAAHSGAYAAYAVKWVLHYLAVVREWTIYGAIFAWNGVRGWLRLLPGRAMVAARRTVAVRREGVFVRAVVSLARKIVRAAENAGNADIHSNGEAFFLRAVLAVCPGMTDTQFFEAAGEAAVIAAKRSDTLHMTRTPKQVVDNTMRALSGRKPSFVDGAVNAVVWRGLTRFVPTRLMLAVSGYLVEG